MSVEAPRPQDEQQRGLFRGRLGQEFIQAQVPVLLTLGLGGLLHLSEFRTVEGRVIVGGMFAASAVVSYYMIARLFDTASKKVEPPSSLIQQLSVLKADPTPELKALLSKPGDDQRLLGQGLGGQNNAELNPETTGELTRRNEAVAIAVNQILDPEKRARDNSDFSRRQVLKVLGEIFSRTVTSQRGLSLLPQEKILLHVVQFGATREEGPAVLCDYVEVLTLIVRAYHKNLGNIPLAKTTFYQALTDAIRAERLGETLVNVPASLSSQAQALQSEAQGRTLITLDEAKTAAQSLVAISFRKIPEARQAAEIAIGSLSSELLRLEPEQAVPITAVLNLSRQYVDLDPLRLISTKEGNEKPVFEREVIHISASGMSALDRLACAVALLCPHFACIEACLGEQIVRVPLGEFYQKRLVEGNIIYLTSFFDQPGISGPSDLPVC